MYQGSIKGKANPSRRSSTSPEMEEGGAGTDSPGAGGEATGTSTIASVDATGTVNEGSSPSPVLGCGEGPTGTLEEEEAIDYGKERRKKGNFFFSNTENGEKREIGRESIFLF